MTISSSTTNSHTNGHIKHHQKPSPDFDFGFSTRAIHVGSEPDPVTGAIIPPISLSTTYKQDAVGVHKVCVPGSPVIILINVLFSSRASSIPVQGIRIVPHLSGLL